MSDNVVQGDAVYLQAPPFPPPQYQPIMVEGGAQQVSGTELLTMNKAYNVSELLCNGRRIINPPTIQQGSEEYYDN